MRRPPRTAKECPKRDIAGVLHRLENLAGLAFATSAMPRATLVDVQGQLIRPLTATGVQLYGPRPGPVMPRWRHPWRPPLAPP